MSDCQVMRCAEPAEHVIELNRDPLLEGVVCSTHKAAMDSGAAWRWEPDEADYLRGNILMGEDLDARDITITKFIGWSDHALVLHPDGTTAVILKFEKQSSDGAKAELRLIVSHDLLNRLTDSLTLFWGSDER